MSGIVATGEDPTFPRMAELPMRTIGGLSMAGSLFRLGLVDRVRVMDQRLVLLDFRVAERPGDGRG